MKLAAARCCELGSLLIVDKLCNAGRQSMRFWFDHRLRPNNSMKFCLSSSTALLMPDWLRNMTRTC